MIEFIGFTWVGLIIAVVTVSICLVLWDLVFSDQTEVMSILFFGVLLSISCVNLRGTAQFYVEDTVIGVVEGHEDGAILSGRGSFVDVYVRDGKAEELVGKDVTMICSKTVVGDYCNVKTVR